MDTTHAAGQEPCGPAAYANGASDGVYTRWGPPPTCYQMVQLGSQPDSEENRPDIRRAP